MQKTEMWWCKFFCQLASFTYWFNCSSNTSLSIWRPENRKWKILPKYQGIKCKFTFNQTFLPLLFLYALGLNSWKFFFNVFESITKITDQILLLEIRVPMNTSLLILFSSDPHGVVVCLSNISWTACRSILQGSFVADSTPWNKI